MYSLPKLHAATVHYPIALLTLSSLAGLLYLYGRARMTQRVTLRANLRALIWWTMLLGWISGAVAVLSGLLVQAGLPPQPPYVRILNWHIGTGLALLVVYGTLLYLRWQRRPSRTPKRRRAPSPTSVAENHAVDLLDQPAARWWIALLLAVGVLLVFTSGLNGGRLVYDWGVNILPVP